MKRTLSKEEKKMFVFIFSVRKLSPKAVRLFFDSKVPGLDFF